MLDSFIVSLVVSTILGFLAGLGVGGGSLLILWLTLVLGLEHTQARIINLLFFIPSAVISSLFRWKQGVLDWKKIIPAIGIGCATAALFSFLSHQINLELIKKIFGGLLIAAGIREILYNSKAPR